MLIEKDYCDYDTCVALKELGYPTKITFVSEFGSIEIPINSGSIQLYEAQKWLREEKHIEIVVLSKGMIGAPYDAQVYGDDYVIQEGIEYSSYEEALLGGIKEAVKLLKNN
jgi:hypothetical protein